MSAASTVLALSAILLSGCSGPNIRDDVAAPAEPAANDEPFPDVGTSNGDDWPVHLATEDEPHRPFAEALRRCLWRGAFTASAADREIAVVDAEGLRVSQSCVDRIAERTRADLAGRRLAFVVGDPVSDEAEKAPSWADSPAHAYEEPRVAPSTPGWWAPDHQGGCEKGKRCGRGCIRADATCHVDAPQPAASSPPHCKTGCPCGGACISCSKRCRH
jgi:hypothetical protein